MFKRIGRLAKFLLVMTLSVVIGVLLLDFWVTASTKDQIISLSELEDADCILVLGAGVWENNQPSPMLRDRLDRSIEIFKVGVAPYLVMSGDHGQSDYDEVNVMKGYAMDAGIDSNLIYMDHAGFSTYESLYRLKYIFKAEKIIIVTQKYHLYRALYIANALGLDAVGVAASEIRYGGQSVRDLREVLARNKDFFSTWFLPAPTYLGDSIPLGSGGDLTND
ncbi:MAG: SanA protein [Firmicutes bacterium HGW-Firmicutes-19]|jgi:SanA protein|nr:MAG: SanA protein [Firmicutes bacterium HGW-Firmicutes-19]